MTTDNPETNMDDRSEEIGNDTVCNLLATIHKAIIDDDFALYKSNIEKGGLNVNQRSQILHLICKQRTEVGTVEYLQEVVRLGCDVRAKDHNGRMPIHVACSFANHRAVEFLVDLHPSLCNEVVESTLSPLIITIDSFSSEKEKEVSKTVDVLLRHGADVNKRIRDFHHTPLLCAVCHDKRTSDIVRVLLEAGADVTARSWMDRTPLIHAVSKKDQQSVRYLLGAKSDPDVVDSLGCTPLSLACLKQYAPIIQDLVQYGADINSERSSNNKDLLPAVIQSAHHSITELLFKLGLRITSELIMLKNPVGCAIKKRSSEHLKILLRENCPLDEPLHELPLIEAVQEENVDADVLDILIKSGADFSDALLSCAITAKPDDEALTGLVLRYHSDVRPLKTLCCFSVRKCLGLGIKAKVQRLVEDRVIPRALVKDIMLEHVLNV
ncbi:ankyrin repeat and SOCS box protein 14-like [Argopecten irradians]|uniref:ankyrin repeat and SOCS box protein 14-like n=1 Tax=Argopecten irradians TaxID=31199 RepID=UPI0037135D3B